MTILLKISKVLSVDHHPSLLCIHSVFVVIIFLFLATSHVGSVSRPGMETIKAPAVEWRVLTIEMREVPVFVNQKELGAPSFKLSWCFTHACNFALITPYLTMSVCVCLFIYLCTNLRLEHHGFCSHVSFKSCL